MAGDLAPATVSPAHLEARLRAMLEAVSKHSGALEMRLQARIADLQAQVANVAQPKKEVTRVTEHDAEGRIKSFERVSVVENVAVAASDDGVSSTRLKIAALSDNLASAATSLENADLSSPSDGYRIQNERYRAIVDGAADDEKAALKSFMDMAYGIERETRDLELNDPPRLSKAKEVNFLGALVLSAFSSAVRSAATQDLRIMRLEKRILELEGNGR